MKIKIACCFVLIIFNCCVKEKTKEIAINKDLYLIDLDNINQEEDVPMSRFFDAVELIFLETTDEALIGRCSNIQVFEDKLLILDEEVTESLFIYNNDGTFLYKISKIGQGSGEYVSLSDFTINTDKREIYLLDAENRNILRFNIDNGEYISTINLEEGDYCRNIQYNGGRLYADANDKHAGTLLNEIDMETGKKINKWLDPDLYNQGWMGTFFGMGGHFHSKNTDRNMYAQIFMDTVIAIENGTIRPFLAIQSKNWLKKEELDKFTQNDLPELVDYIKTNHKIYGATYIYEYANLIAFEILSDSQSFLVLFNKEDRTSVMTSRIKIDLIYENENMYAGGFIASDSGGLYVIRTSEYFKELDTQPIPAILKEHLRAKYAHKISAIKEDNNPVLIYLKNSKYDTR